MNLELFRYGRLMADAGDRVVQHRGDGYHVQAVSPDLAHLGAWLRFDFRDGGREPLTAADGWKVHVSVDADRVAEAWDAILPIVAGRRLLAKACGPAIVDRIGDPEHRQAGKTIVLYGRRHPRVGDPSFWGDVLDAVEDALRAARIPPGWTVGGDRPVPGSAYSFVRNDSDAFGNYLAAEGHFNPAGFPCPFDGVELASDLPRPAPGNALVDATRQLGFVGGSWWAVGSSIEAKPGDGSATRLASTLAAHGVTATVVGDDTVRVPVAELEGIAAGWFAASIDLRSRTFAEAVATGWHDATGEYPLILPTAGGDCPSVGIELADGEDAGLLASVLRTSRLATVAEIEECRVSIRVPADAFVGNGSPQATRSLVATLVGVRGRTPGSPRP